MEDKHNIQKGKMQSNCRILPDHIVCKITPRNKIRRANTCDPVLKLSNEEVTSDIHKHNLWNDYLDAHWDHMHNTDTLRHTINGLSSRAPPTTLNNSIIFNNKITTTRKHIANCFPNNSQNLSDTQHTK